MFVALMMGQVTPPETNDRNFYEEDGDFSSVSTVLHDGWGWGLNKAHAFCDTFEGTDTNCAFGGEPDEETSRYDEVTYESGGDAPAPTEPTPEPEPEPTAVPYNQFANELECRAETFSGYENCLLVIAGGVSITTGMCTALVVAPLVSACAAYIGSRGVMEKSKCDMGQNNGLSLCHEIFKDRSGTPPP